MRARDFVLALLFLPLLTAATPSDKYEREGSTRNAGMYRYEGCGDNFAPMFGAVIAFGALARRRRRPA